MKGGLPSLWGLDCDILTAMEPLNKDNSFFKKEYGVCISAMMGRPGCSGYFNQHLL